MSAVSRLVCLASMVGLAQVCGCVRIECETNSDCSDGNPCTSDVCQDRLCENLPFCTEDSQCDDGNQCTNDVCQIGCCINTPPACTVDSDCSDGDEDTIDVCLDGCCANAGCVVDSDCDDGDACTTDSCDTSDGQCITTAVVCSGGEDCDPEVGCVFCLFADCDDGVACTDDSCDEASDACVNAVNNKNCVDDGSFCNGVELCDPIEGCVSSGFPCEADESCDETNSVCIGPRGELNGSISQIIPIPDSTGSGFDCAAPAELAIELSGAMAGSVVSGVKVSFEIQHECTADLSVELWTLDDQGVRVAHSLKTASEVGGGDGGCQEEVLEVLAETVDAINHFDKSGISPNRTWHLEVRDCWTADAGDIRSFEIWVEYGPE